MDVKIYYKGTGSQPGQISAISTPYNGEYDKWNIEFKKHNNEYCLLIYQVDDFGVVHDVHQELQSEYSSWEIYHRELEKSVKKIEVDGVVFWCCDD